MSKAGKRSGDAVDALERSPSHLLHRALQLALDLYAEEAAAGAPTQRQYAVLSAVAVREGLTQTDLVRATGIDRSTLADLVARMIGKGLLVRERSTSDGRANAVHLSEKGQAALNEAQPRAGAADQRILATLPKGKRDSFVEALHILARAGDKAQVKADKAAASASADGATAPAKVKKAKADKPEKAGGKKKKKAKKAEKILELA